MLTAPLTQGSLEFVRTRRPALWRIGFSFRPRSQTALSPFDPRFARISAALRMTRTKGERGGRIVELARMKNNPPPALREPPASCRRQVTCSALPRTVCYKGAVQRVQTRCAIRWRTAIPVGTDVPGGPLVWHTQAFPLRGTSSLTRAPKHLPLVAGTSLAFPLRGRWHPKGDG